MSLEKAGLQLGKEIIAWTRTSGKGLLATRPMKINTIGLKYCPNSLCDSISVASKKQYNDIIQKMVSQRKKVINTYNPDVSLETTLQNFKDNYIGLNKDIRGKIMHYLGDEEAIYSNNFIQTQAPKLDALIKQGYLPRDTVLYRGSTPYDFGFDNMSNKEFIEKFYKKGKLFRIPIYPETTLDKTIGKSFAKENILFKINVPKGTNGIYMERLGLPKTGSYVNEEEILLPRDLIYKFKSHTQKDGYDLIELDIIHKKPFWKKIHEFWNEMN